MVPPQLTVTAVQVIWIFARIAPMPSNMEERRLWVEATPSVAFERPRVELSTETLTQIDLDLARTFGPMLFRESRDEAAIMSRRRKVQELLITWLQSNEKSAYMQGMNHVMAMCYREVEDDIGALQVFDYMVHQEELFHADGMKFFQAVQGTAEQLRLWHHILLDNVPGVPLKFASHMLLSSTEKILSCQPEDIHDVLVQIPKKIQTPEDVESLLEQTDWAAPAAEAVEAVSPHKILEEIADWQVPTTLKPLPARARLPKRWQPWKFLSVAMVVPWLLMHATAVHQPRARRTRSSTGPGRFFQADAAAGLRSSLRSSLLAQLVATTMPVWRNAASGHDFCGRIGPSSRCLCGHEYSSHVWSKGRKELRPACGSCSCTGFRYMPRRPEEIGEWWLPRRKGFDIRSWRPKCKCQHSHEEHDPNTLSCRCCGCHSFSSAWECITCEGKWEDHESLWENEEERRLLGKPIGQAFMPLASTPDIQQMVLETPAQLSDDQSWSLPYRSKPERSVRLMQERCSNYGRNNSRCGQGSLEDAFPPRPPRGVGSAGASQAASGFTGGLEDAFPPRQRSNSGGRLR
eukprot:s2600_g6.t1